MATDDKELLLNSDKDRNPSEMVKLTETTPLRFPSDCMDVLPSPNNPTSKEHELSGASKLNKNLKELFAPPQRRKSCSYLKLEEWPSEDSQLDTFADDTVSSSIILSVNSPTEPLSEFQQSNQPSSSSISGLLTSGDKNVCSENVELVTFHSIKSTISSDRSPTVVGSRGPTEVSPNSSFEEALLISKLTLQAKNEESADSSISATQKQLCSSGLGLKTLELSNATGESKTRRAVRRVPKLPKKWRRRKMRKTGKIGVPKNLLPKSSVEKPQSQIRGRSKSAPTPGRQDMQ